MAPNSAALPNPEPSNWLYVFEVVVNYLRDKHHVGYNRIKHNDRCVGGVKKFYSIGINMACLSLVVNGDVGLEALKVVDQEEYSQSCNHIVEIGESFSKKTFLERHKFVGLIVKVTEEGNEGSLVLLSNFEERKGLPNQVFTNVGGNE